MADFIDIGGAFVRKDDIRLVYDSGRDLTADYVPGGSSSIASVVILNDGKVIAARETTKEIIEIISDTERQS